MLARWVHAAAGVAICLAAASPTLAQDRAGFPAAIDGFAHRALGRVEAVPGMAVAVVDHDGAVHTAGYGVADVTTGAAVTSQTRFYIASATKPFTALAFAALSRRGEIDLDAPLSAWAPGSGVSDDIARRVTLADLLSHRSGVDNGPMAFRLAYSGDWTPQTMRRLAGATRARQDGAYGAFAYSNSGYNLATVLLETTRGQDWQALVQSEVLAPLGMTQTTARIDAVRASGQPLAAGHLGLVPGRPERSYLQKSDATMQSAGGLVSTAHDMAVWLQAQVNDGVVAGRRVFPQGLIASTHASLVTQVAAFGDYVRTGYGLGWQVGRYGDDVLIHHFGNFSGSRAHVSFMPDRGLGVAVLVNEDAVAGDLADLVANYAYDWFAGLPDIENVYDAKLEALVVRRDRRRAALAEGLQGRAARPSTLALSNADYVGDYVNEAWGVMSVREVQGRLVLSIGAQQAVAENYTDPESIRVELTPLVGQVVVFQPSVAARPASLVFSGATFERRPGVSGVVEADRDPL